jgi:hypothetical protein
MAQPRLFAAMASDGLLPKIFQQRNAQGNLVYSNVLCGIPMAIVATFVPFSYLDDCISVGILVAFNMTNTSLILMKCNDYDHHHHHDDYRPHHLERTTTSSSTTSTSSSIGTSTTGHQHQSPPPFRLSRHLVAFHVVALGAALAPRFVGNDGGGSSSSSSSEGQGTTSSSKWSIVVGCLLMPLVYAVYIHSHSSKQSHFGAHLTTAAATTTTESTLFSNRSSLGVPIVSSTDDDDSSSFETPMVPLIPLLGIAVNSFLIAQLEWSGLFLLFLYLATVSGLYAMYCSSRTTNISWGAAGGGHYHHYDCLGSDAADDGDGGAAIPMDVLDHRHDRRRDDDDDDPLFDPDGPILLREFSMPKR